MFIKKKINILSVLTILFFASTPLFGVGTYQKDGKTYNCSTVVTSSIMTKEGCSTPNYAVHSSSSSGTSSSGGSGYSSGASSSSSSGTSSSSTKSSSGTTSASSSSSTGSSSTSSSSSQSTKTTSPTAGANLASSSDGGNSSASEGSASGENPGSQNSGTYHSKSESAAAIAQAREMENIAGQEVLSAMEAANKATRELESIEKAMGSAYKDYDRYYLNNVKETKKVAYEKAIKNRAHKMESYQYACKNFSETCKEYNYVGDPVYIAKGDFIADYQDFEAEDYLDKFTLTRSLAQTVSGETFGTAWQSSLDSRIVRCNVELDKNFEKSVDSCISKMNDFMQQSDSFIQKYGLASFIGKVGVNEYSEMKEKLACLKEYKAFCQKEKETWQKINTLNKYSAYGRYKDPQSYNGFEDMLIFLEDDGTEYTFKYSENGQWKSLGKLSASKMYIQGLDSNGKFSTSINTDGGYKVIYADGKSKKFSKYGILEELEDANHNKTFYFSENGKINKILLKTGENLELKRDSEGKLLEVKGNVSGKTNFYYSGKFLTGVLNNSGIYISYTYNDKGLLSKITKSDSSFIELEYEFNSILDKDVCVSVKNNLGEIETFSYEPENKKVVHTTLDGVKEYFTYNDFNMTVYSKDCYGKETQLGVDEDGLIIWEKRKGGKKYFQYDDSYRLCQTSSEDGTCKSIEYNDKNQITKITDADGFTLYYTYDENGNLTESKFEDTILASYQYYSNGLLKQKTENSVTTTYEYNKYGSITKEKRQIPGFVDSVQSWTYDSKNRVIKYTGADSLVTEISYEDEKEKSRCEIFNGRRKTQYFYDGKNRDYIAVSQDLKDGKTFKREYRYDVRGNVKEIYIDGNLSEEREYSKSNVLLNKVVWNSENEGSENKRQGVKQTFEYNQEGYLLSEKRSLVNEQEEAKSEITVKEISYDKKNDLTCAACKSFSGETYSMYYDKDDQLVRQINPEGKIQLITYTKAGRVNSIKDFDNSFYSYVYKKDGSYIITIEKNGLKAIETYDNGNRLVSYKDFSGFLIEKKYSPFGLVEEKGPGYEKYISYDFLGRVIEKREITTKDNLEKSVSIVYDDKNFSAKIFKNQELYEELYLDAWNRKVLSLGPNGKFSYTWDGANNLTSSTDQNGEKISVLYNPYGQIVELENSNGNKFTYDYNAVGKLISARKGQMELFTSVVNYQDITIENHESHNSSVKYYADEKGHITMIDRSKTGKRSFDYNLDEKSLTVSDEIGNSHLYKYDLDDNLIYEKNPLGVECHYEYDSLKRLVSKKDFEGRVMSLNYDDKNAVCKITYDSGKSETVEMNGFGQFTEILSDGYNYKYKYDKSGNLIYFEEVNSGVKAEYFYDQRGFCIEKKSDTFDILYDYDSYGRISRISEISKDVWIEFSYDSRGNETERKYSNGNVIFSQYDDCGLILRRTCKNSIGLTVCDYTLTRDSSGRITCVQNKDGEKSFYTYDEKGHLVKCKEPFNQKLSDIAQKETLECGLSSYKFNDSLDYFETSYGYTKNGSLAWSQNPYGKIIYEYDGMNRLISKYGEKSKENGMTFDWDKNGNLLHVKSAAYEMVFEYDDINRPSKIISRNLSDYTEKTLTYTYDFMGRRISETENGQKTRFFVYDGFSTDLLFSTDLMQSGNSISNYIPQNAKDDFANLYESQKLYRWTEQNDYSPYEEYRSTDFKSYSRAGNSESWESDFTIKDGDYTDSRPLTVMSNGGVEYARLYSGADFSNDDVEFLIPDYSDNTAAISDLSSNVTYENFYDVWGNQSGEEKNFSYSTSHSFVDGEMKLLNLGYRDYSPAMKSFTSQDPARDGGNWYAFCPTDPLNYKDVQGLVCETIIPFYNMTNYTLKAILLGQCKQGQIDADYLHLSGCYVTAYANIAKTMHENGAKNVNENLCDPIAINNRKDLFSEGTGLLLKEETASELYGEGQYKFYTKEEYGVDGMILTLIRMDSYSEKFYVAAVVDLSNATEGVTNHMVCLNEACDIEGNFSSVNDITGSSNGDAQRLNDGKLSEYKVGNMKEVRIMTDSEHASCFR